MAGASQALGDYRYYLQDHLGSTRSIRDGAKAPLARYAYTPYGQPLVNVGLALNVGYTGHAWDNVTQQWFAPYRYYDPSNARWLWRDPRPRRRFLGKRKDEMMESQTICLKRTRTETAIPRSTS